MRDHLWDCSSCFLGLEPLSISPNYNIVKHSSSCRVLEVMQEHTQPAWFMLTLSMKQSKAKAEPRGQGI